MKPTNQYVHISGVYCLAFLTSQKWEKTEEALRSNIRREAIIKLFPSIWTGIRLQCQQDWTAQFVTLAPESLKCYPCFLFFFFPPPLIHWPLLHRSTERPQTNPADWVGHNPFSWERERLLCLLTAGPQCHTRESTVLFWRCLPSPASNYSVSLCFLHLLDFET